MLSDEDKAIYEWQLDVAGLGEAGQEKLRGTTALVSRIGGLGGPVCFALAAAGIGKLVIAHAGNLTPADLNRQILMRYEDLDASRVESAKKTLAAFNPGIEVEAVPENIGEENVADLVGRADIVFGCAPMFEERLLIDRECMRQGKPLIDSAMYHLEGRVLPIVPGKTACLACLYPEVPSHWKRRFPVIGAVSAMVGNIGALEGIKLITGVGEVNLGKMIYVDAATMTMRKISVERREGCEVCEGDDF
ncbi:MAG: HesA/MoeB/ThiF family protein [Verrucomicrobiota bacterium]